MSSSRKAVQLSDSAFPVMTTATSTIAGSDTVRKRIRIGDDISSPIHSSPPQLEYSFFSSSNKEALLESEVSSLKAEVEQLQSLRRLDAIKFQSAEQRLKRYIVSLEQDANDARSLSDETRTQYEKLVEESARKKKDDSKRIYFAEQKIVDLEKQIEQYVEKERMLVSTSSRTTIEAYQKSHQLSRQKKQEEDENNDQDNVGSDYPFIQTCNYSDEDCVDGRKRKHSEQMLLLVQILDKKNALLEKQLQDYSTQVDGLKQQLKEAEENRYSRYSVESKLSSQSPNMQRKKDSDEVTGPSPISPAPTELLSELNRIRVQLADAQRIIRQQTRTMEDLQNKTKLLSYVKDNARRCEIQIETLQSELSTLRKERDTFDHVAQLWSDWVQFFANKQEQWISPHENITMPFETDTNTLPRKFTAPPEMSAVQNVILALEDKYKKLEGIHSQIKQELQASQRRADSLDDKARETTLNMEQNLMEKKQVENKLLQVEKQLTLMQAQEAIWRKESDGLRDLLATYKLVEDQLLLKSKSGTILPTPENQLDEENAAISGLQLSLKSSRDQINILEKAVSELQSESDVLTRNHKALQDEHERVLNKFNLLKDALLREREKAEEAEVRTIKAESLAGKGSFNEDMTRVVHLRSNPLLSAIREKYEQEINTLKLVVEESKNKEATSHRDSSMPGLDPQKYNQRLKDNFRKQIGIFRESVYLITGYKIDMLSDNTDRPLFRVRSMYAEREEDHLMFIWPLLDEGELPKSLDLLDSAMAQTLMNEPCFKAMTQFNSVPAFTAGLTLALFEKQTFVGE